MSTNHEVLRDSLNDTTSSTVEADINASPRPLLPATPTQTVVTYRDPSDVRLIRRLVLAIIVIGLFAFASLVGLLYLMHRRPDRIVVSQMPNGERVVMIDNKWYGFSEGVKMMPDRPGKEDKIYLASEFIRLLYEVDPASRSKDVKRALELMVPYSAKALSKYLVDSGVLAKQRAEAWQTRWLPEDVAMDKTDPWTVRVIGKQQVSRVVGGEAVSEVRRVKLTVRVHKDPSEQRLPNNLNTGYLIEGIDHKDLDFEEVTHSAVTTDSSATGGAPVAVVRSAATGAPLVPAP